MESSITTETKIFLNETMENLTSDDYTVVESEIEFLRHDGKSERILVRGAALCDYVRALCQARKIKPVEIISPRSRLRFLVGDTSDKINPALLNRSLEILDRENPKTLAELLFHLTGEEFWFAPISIEHAARFLTIEITDEIFDFAEAQRQIWLQTNQDKKIGKAYTQEFSSRADFLWKWFFDEKTRVELGEFPLVLSKNQSMILGERIEQILRETEGAGIVDFPKQSPNKKIYAGAIIDYFTHHPSRLTADDIAQITSLLTSVERAQLEKLLPQNAIAPLAADADVQSALQWATETYLPFRHTPKTVEKCAEADQLADSFANWLLENYPKMAFGDYENSPINLRTFYTVKNLWEQNYWVLWTVVDGLNYTNHQKLLKLLGENSANLRVAENSPVFAVLPTITEKAKYGLTSGKFPSENSKRDWNHKNNFFNAFPSGVYAGSTGMDKMATGLKAETPTICYWNYLKIDDCYHNETDAISVRHEVEAQIQSLAAKINSLVEDARDKNRVAVVICSDHGQMVDHCRKLDVDLGNNHTHGRTSLDPVNSVYSHTNSAFTKTNDGNTVYLNPTSFRLSEPTTIALGSTYFVDLKANAETGAVGVHGGLYPEEAVVGLAVLMRDPARRRLSASINGDGETGKAGTIVLTIDNPNPATVNPLSITIENLVLNEQGELLLAKVGAKDIKKFEIPIERFPVATSGEEFEVKGVLRYEFDDGTQDECSVTGKFVCKSLYTSKNPSLLNRFKK